MVSGPNYFSIVFKNNQIRDWAKKAAKELLIKLEDIKISSNGNGGNSWGQNNQSPTRGDPIVTSSPSRMFKNPSEVDIDSLRSQHQEKMKFKKIKLIAEQVLQKGYHNAVMCNWETPNKLQYNRKIQPLFLKKSGATSKKLPVEVTNNTIDAVDSNNKNNAGSVFLTDVGLNKYPVTNRRNTSSKPQLSRRNPRPPPSERAASYATTYKNKTILEDNKSFNLVKCRQRLKDLTDNKVENLMKMQEKRKLKLEKYYKNQKNQVNQRIAVQIEKDEHRKIVLKTYKNKIKEIEDTSINEYKSHINELGQRNMKTRKNL
jgi:hypothetical protein